MAKAVVDQMKNAILLWSCQSNSSKRHFWWVNLHLLHVPDLLGQDEKYYAPISHSQGMFQEAIPKALMLPYWQERRAQQSHFGMGNTLLKHHGITILQSDQLYFLLCQKKKLTPPLNKEYFPKKGLFLDSTFFTGSNGFHLTDLPSKSVPKTWQVNGFHSLCQPQNFGYELGSRPVRYGAKNGKML